MGCDWVKRYMGRPWISGARGPVAYDCWGLVWHVYGCRFGVVLPAYPGICGANLMAAGRRIDQGRRNYEWQRIDTPEHGCTVAMSQSRRFHHVGIWLDLDGGRILHSRAGAGTLLESIGSLKRSRWRVAFYRHRDFPEPTP